MKALFFFQFVEYGNEGAILLLQTCLDLMNLHSGEISKMQPKQEIFSAVFGCLLHKPNFSTVFCQAIRSEWMNDGFLENLSKALNLSTSEKIAIGLALSDSENFDFRMRGRDKIWCPSFIEVYAAAC